MMVRMSIRGPWLAVVLMVGCGGGPGGDGSVSGDPTSAGSSASTGESSDDGGTDAGSDATASGSIDEGSSSASETDASASDTHDDTDDTVGGAGGPVELYRGPVGDAVVPGWDPEAPRPLVMMGRQGQTWSATLAQIGADGSLSQNLAEEIVVWGWEVPPPVLFDGQVGGSIAGWSADAPRPVVMLGYSEAQHVWWSTLASIGPGGELGDNVSDRLVVWGWTPADLGAPHEIYAGPLDASAVIPGWSSSDPDPLVMLGRLTGVDTWQATLASIDADGVLGDNLAEELVVWGW